METKDRIDVVLAQCEEVVDAIDNLQSRINNWRLILGTLVQEYHNLKGELDVKKDAN